MGKRIDKVVQSETAPFFGVDLKEIELLRELEKCVRDVDYDTDSVQGILEQLRKHRRRKGKDN